MRINNNELQTNVAGLTFAEVCHHDQIELSTKDMEVLERAFVLSKGTFQLKVRPPHHRYDPMGHAAWTAWCVSKGRNNAHDTELLLKSKPEVQAFWNRVLKALDQAKARREVRERQQAEKMRNVAMIASSVPDPHSSP